MSEFSHISADLEATVANHETRLTAAEENIQGLAFHLQLYCVLPTGKVYLPQYLSERLRHTSKTSYNLLFSELQMTDVELDARVTALEENGGSASQNGILAGQCTKRRLIRIAT